MFCFTENHFIIVSLARRTGIGFITELAAIKALLTTESLQENNCKRRIRFAVVLFAHGAVIDQDRKKKCVTPRKEPLRGIYNVTQASQEDKQQEEKTSKRQCPRRNSTQAWLGSLLHDTT
ncbi:hypothetical protein OJAV_G00129860 [Oryzias javanicus]|uniref:Uncharacterized protein n=1 Tax=Oryzias javanicus TaxID=123683 RepID=A0A3S2P247_ORYJA|nr:hypothetical protein OJAV_G00129860 [Oryzias javanicus]